MISGWMAPLILAGDTLIALIALTSTLAYLVNKAKTECRGVAWTMMYEVLGLGIVGNLA
jgi:hypothetical protein